MPSLNRHEEFTRFTEFSANGKKSIENFFTHKLFVIIWIAMLRSSYCNFLCSFQILLFLTKNIQMTSLNRHEKVTPFMEFSVNGKKQPKNLSYRILVIISFGLLRSSYFNFLRSFEIFLFSTKITQMPSSNRHEKNFRFMEFSANGKKNNSKIFPIGFNHYFNWIATVKLLQFLKFISDLSVLNKIYSNAFSKSTRGIYSFHGIFRKW